MTNGAKITSSNGTVYGDPMPGPGRGGKVQAQARRRSGSVSGTVILQGGWSASDKTGDNGWVDLGTITANSDRLMAGSTVDAAYPAYRFKITSTGVGDFECRLVAVRS